MKETWFKKSALTVAASAALTVGLAGCGGGGGGGGGYYTPGPVYYDAWYDVYGSYCGSGQPAPGCNFYSDGVKIIDIEDPYFNNGYYLTYDTWSYYDSYGFSSYYTGWAWQSPTGILYDDYGDALNEKDEQGRDYIADVAERERNVVQGAGEAFAAKYGLSVEAGLQVAKALNDWATLGKDRARTEKDLADFTERLYGIDFNKVKGALAEAQKGETAALEGLVDDAATNWGTTPETMKEILKNWYGNQL